MRLIIDFAAGLLSREASRLTESFIFTVGVGDDFVMRLGVDSIENLRTGIMQVLHASKLSKVLPVTDFVRLINLLATLLVFESRFLLVSSAHERLWVRLVRSPTWGPGDHLEGGARHYPDGISSSRRKTNRDYRCENSMSHLTITLYITHSF